MKKRGLILTASLSALIILVSIYSFNIKVIKKITILKLSSKNISKINEATNKEQQPTTRKSEESLNQNFFINNNSMNITRLIGGNDKFGFTEPKFTSNMFVYTTLYLWGNEVNILNKQLKIVASNSNGDNLEIPDLYKVTKEGHGVVSEKGIICTGRENLSFQLPRIGKWTFNVYLDDLLLGKAIIDIKWNAYNTLTPTQILIN